ncbi:hypothetical protein IAG42_15360 [Streptomyces xanthii]|uniref:Uncharacterized protein n=1 Tax=Streptomyces xanthii TaxID=2768069 RepID=A0A7H1BJ41_9ACTN|nr:hypothetical protein IAG42_15360 [Streptomyces xanthii]
MLPADGSEPLMPGTYGDPTPPAAPAGPAGAAPWGQPWGPQSQQAQDAGPMPSYEWGRPEAQQHGGGGMPPAQQAQAPQAQAPQAQAQQPPHVPQQPQSPHMPQQAYGAQQSQQPQQAYGAQPPQMPQQPQAHQQAQQIPQQPQAHQQPQPLPQQSQAPQLPPQQMPGAGPLPPAAPAGAAYDGDATQYIAPVAAQQPPAAPLPPEQPAADATQFLGRAVNRQPMPGALPDAVPGGPSDSEATQYIPPVPGGPQEPAYGIRPGAPGDRQPPAEFDALFRTEPEGPAASTQQMPRFDPHAQQGPPQQPGVPQYQDAYEPEPSRRKARTGSKLPMVAAVGVGLLVVGIGAGALLGGGGTDDDKTDQTKTVSDASSASTEPSPSVDPAKEQAVALDKLLADSNNSRDSVVRAVANIGACKALPQSSKDLRDAATQRNGLVTRLNGLAIDKLPKNAELKAALTSAWKASASADSHYAAWGDQVAGKKGCQKGHARPTPQRRAGDRASGTASTQKNQAAKIWNEIADQYQLTRRTAVQL